MESTDRTLRIRTAASILFALKQNGCSLSLAAEYLNLSPGTISNWHRFEEVSDRRLGVPTDEHLQKLVALLCYQFTENVASIERFLSDSGSRPWEQFVLLYRIFQGRKPYSEKWESKLKNWESYFKDQRKLANKYGEESTTITLVNAGADKFVNNPPSDTPWNFEPYYMSMKARDFFKRIDSLGEEYKKDKKDIEIFMTKKRKAKRIVTREEGESKE